MDYHIDYLYMTQKQITPSQKRYRANNPTASFRLPKVLKEKLEKLAERGDMTMGQYVRDFLEGVVTEREKEDEIYIRGLEKGYKQGMNNWAIWFECYKCGKQLYFRPRSEHHDAIIGYLKGLRWGHETCPEEQENK